MTATQDQFIFVDTSGKERHLSTAQELSTILQELPSKEWSQGSGSVMLLNNQNGWYLGASRMQDGELLLITSAAKFGEDEYVYVSGFQFSTLASINCGGELAQFPIEFFAPFDHLLVFGSELIRNGHIKFSSQWVVLHNQEWPGMSED